MQPSLAILRHHLRHHLLFGLIASQVVLAVRPALAHEATWPTPRPPQPPLQRSVPNFEAPSATHCARPVSTREVPGLPPQAQPQHGWASDLARGRLDESRRERAAVAPSAPAAVSAAPPPAAESALPDFAAKRHGGFAPDSRPQPQPQPSPQQHDPSPTVTAGVVDDNADFNAYLAFLRRTQVHHRPRDVRERYLLEVKDPRGRGLADAEVLVQSPQGHAMWARTDAGGRAWVHPNAFDPQRAGSYVVTARKDGRQSAAQLTRGQKSAVEVVLDTAADAGRARLDLVFLIDATGSMADEIDKLKATLRTITSEVAGLPSRPDICLGLVAYRDRGDAFLLRSHDFTNDVGGFLRDALLPLRAGGGGDYPEAMNEALHETVHQLSWRGNGATRLVVLLADAPPHLDDGGPQYDESMMVALGKGIKVFSVGASGLDRQGEFIQRQIAQYTGGRFVFLTYANAHQPASGPGRETMHDVRNYSVDTLDRLIVRLVSEELARRGGTGG